MNKDSIIETINSIFGNLFSSIDNTVYSALDNIAFINKDIFNSYYFEKIFGTTTTNGFLLVANSLLIGFVLYYAITYFLSSFGILQQHVERPSQFFFKALIGGLLMNSSLIICQGIIYLNSLISEAIRYIGTDFLNIKICFSELINELNTIIFIEANTNNIFSIDGILKIIFSISFFNIIFSYSIRYIMIKVFILISPFAFLSLYSNNTSVFFKSWLKSFVALLLIESLASIILIIMFSITYSAKDVTAKLLLIGSLFALIKTNTYIKDFIGGISTEVSDSMYMLRTFMR